MASKAIYLARPAQGLHAQVRHGYEDAKSKAADVALVADVKSHEAQVKGGRALRRGKEKVRRRRGLGAAGASGRRGPGG